MTNNIAIIYPRDETTDFLEAIPEFLFERFGERRFIYQRIGFSNKDHRDCISLIEDLSKNDVVIFLGHGRSDGLLGSCSPTFSRQTLISKDQISILQNKKVFSLACRSADFFSLSRINSIGFSNLITEMNEIYQERQRPNNGLAYQWVTQEDVTYFRGILTTIVRQSLKDFIDSDAEMEKLFLALKLRFNKNISNLIMQKSPGSVHGVVNLLYESKSGMKLFK